MILLPPGHESPDSAVPSKQPTLYRVLRWVVVAGVAVFGAAGVWNSTDLDNYLSAAIFTGLFGGIYLLGFLRDLPEALGGIVPNTREEEARRWERFLRASFWITVTAMLGVIATAARTTSPPDSLLLLVAGLLLVAVLAASLLALQMRHLRGVVTWLPEAAGRVGTGRWRTAVRWLRARWSPRLSLRSASLLILFSLGLVTSFELGCNGNTYYRGYEIVGRKTACLPLQLVSVNDISSRIVEEIDRATYTLALAAALATFVLSLTVMRRRPMSRRSLAWWCGVTGALALWPIADWLLFGFGDLDSRLAWLPLGFWLTAWLAPPLLWIRYKDTDRWRRWRALFIILYLPCVAISDSLILYLSWEAPGYLACFIGVQWLWWGYLRLSDQPAEPAAGDEMTPAPAPLAG